MYKQVVTDCVCDTNMKSLPTNLLGVLLVPLFSRLFSILIFNHIPIDTNPCCNFATLLASRVTGPKKYAMTSYTSESVFYINPFFPNVLQVIINMPSTAQLECNPFI